MSDSPFFDTWMRTQAQILEAQAPFWNQMASAVKLTGNPDMTSAAEELWSETRNQGREWVKIALASVPG
jgi:hypothetical protein